ncbi:L-glutamine ABC transporter membrane protein /L-glutamate ABC transporter membrane protein /L-aspartate ABC transporter membrane protein /L-asparagine ABC transporter membrane protein [Jannaschia faecimaris]|uniref:L-glutamine ABC transporter membrane protein /L-glutamate ABC transporter membrane protein /L-aspartate ABC transporter membrane protein /L-asparagine ABC transporter membrane protein n=1 Tax=Jannaschia faecimaris TaxID=1244108 RepID=A0A1H3TSN2_9RHOB|nr:amino acid ABC transporter permease [Jannaschia faecimaris]SDZ52958.1 L-glutamine ABC transporter membrane protein /L-glutamate ABC transporter membrane protein /L-aspartate ABC transporter membrane protein /L-asparagine ABC transporter membrane protein [Jannaschia faecimaris]
MSDMHAESVAFVRETEIPPAPPPVTETGAVKWMRENLFSGIANTVMTVIGVIVVIYLLSGLIPWILNGTWEGSSIRDCREVLGDSGGGCFAVLAERWPQLLFGFQYPDHLRWRPTVAFVLLFLAVPPVLFFKLPRWMLIFTALYPFLAYWLIWGGTLMAPIFSLLAVAFGYVAFTRAERYGFVLGLTAGVITAAVILWIGGFVTASAPELLAIEAVPSRELGGFMLNMILGVVCVSLSVPLGIVLALGRQSRLPVVKGFCVVFIEFVRGVPLITLLFVANVVLAYFLPPDSNFDLIVRVIIMITMFSSAYIAEVIRGGLAALPKGQYEAGDSLGLDYAQAMRLIILPQALKISIPGIVNVAVGLFKDTTLVSVISMFDLVGMIRGPILSSTAWTGVYWELWAAACVLFFTVCYGISQYSQWLERQLRTDHR